MTLRGEGVGIWDGRWDDFYSQDEIDDVQKFLEEQLGSFADDAGSGSLTEVFDDAAYETGGESEEEE
jgi:hypothetical protein